MDKNIKKIIGYALIVIVILLTLKFVKMLPAFMKVLALAADAITIYYAYILIKNKK